MAEAWRPELSLESWAWCNSIAIRHEQAWRQGKMKRYWKGERAEPDEVILHVMRQHEGQRIRRRRAKRWARIVAKIAK